MPAHHRPRGTPLDWTVGILTIVTLAAVGFLVWFLNPANARSPEEPRGRPTVTGTYFPPAGVVCELDRVTGRVCTTLGPS